MKHPVSEHFLASLRDASSSTGRFAATASQLASFLLWEACRDLSLASCNVAGFDGTLVPVRKIATSPACVSILRAGEVFTEPFRRLFPDAPVFHLGIRRIEATLDHDVYLDTIPNRISADRVLIVDPMLATGGSALVAIDRIRRVYDGTIDVVALVAAPVGVLTILEHNASVRITVAALDDRLNDQGYIIPGLGDAGDRFFGTGSS